ncbi:MAG: DUF2335 domain-containing protein [Proteobacteria bacterium]|nr:DUF2335 domain-containing protein [Pseudomonadota bacterium]
MPKPPIPRQAHKPPQQQQHQVIATQWQGPLPPPEALEKFNAVVTNGAERIVCMVEEEQRHRQKYESNQLAAMIRDTRRGHYIGLAICLASIGGATAIAFAGLPWEIATALVGVPILGVITAIVNSKTK